ncbi:MAG: hypothetical protein FJ224_04770 [Lentisphaerae bacterium]|nr:hypothetical protein [Lentisphaerota bacterium]
MIATLFYGMTSVQVSVLALLLVVLSYFLGVLAGRRSAGGGGAGRSSAGRPDIDQDLELYVGNLPYDTSDRDLQGLFSKHGKVTSARVIRNRGSGKSKGYGFVVMGCARDVETAVSALEGSQYKGRKLVVSEAKSRARDNE